MQYNQNPNVYYIRPKTPKLKNDAVTVILKILLLGGIFFSVIFTDIISFNSLFLYKISSGTSDYFSSLTGGANMLDALSILDDGMLLTSYKVIVPIVMTLLYFGLYILYVKLFAYLMFNQFMVLGAEFDIRKFRICLDCSFIFLTLAIGFGDLAFTFYPTAYTVGKILVNLFAAVVALAIFFFSYTRKMEKKYYPIVLHIMMIPAITLLLFV